MAQILIWCRCSVAARTPASSGTRPCLVCAWCFAARTGSCLTVEPGEAASVPCGVFAIQDDDELALDHYEGYPVFYQKQTLHVPEVMAIGTKDVVLRDIDAMIYTMPTNHPLGLPSTGYWKICKQGYRDFHFALRHLEKALFDSRAELE